MIRSIHSPPGSRRRARITSLQSPPSLSPAITPSTFYCRLKTHRSVLADRINGRIDATYCIGPSSVCRRLSSVKACRPTVAERCILEQMVL